MRTKILWTLIVAVTALAVANPGAVNQSVRAQGRAAANPELIARRNAIENELQSIAIVERKLMIPMRDGKRIATDVYRPKDTSKKYPTIFVAHAVQLQFLGRAQRRAARHDQ